LIIHAHAMVNLTRFPARSSTHSASIMLPTRLCGLTRSEDKQQSWQMNTPLVCRPTFPSSLVSFTFGLRWESSFLFYERLEVLYDHLVLKT
jgi:hypothetical protein